MQQRYKEILSEPPRSVKIARHRMLVKTFHVRWILSSNHTRVPVQQKITRFSPSDSRHSRESIVADNRKSCRRSGFLAAASHW